MTWTGRRDECTGTFRRLLSWFLIVQHIFIYTLAGQRETIVVSREHQPDKGQFVRIKFVREKEEGISPIKWQQDFKIERESFQPGSSKGSSTLPEGVFLKKSAINKKLIFSKRTKEEHYQFEITPQGDVKLLSLQQMAPLEISVPGRFSALESNTAEAEDLSIGAPSIYLNSKMNIKRLKLRVAGRKDGETGHSPIVNGASSLLRIGERLRIEQEANDTPEKFYIESLFENQGKILNWEGTDQNQGYVVDLAGNDLIQRAVSKDVSGKIDTEISAMGPLKIQAVRKLVNQGRIESGMQSFKNGSQTGKHYQSQFINNKEDTHSQLSLEVTELANQKGGALAASRTTILSEQLHNQGEIDGFKSLNLELKGEAPSLNAGSLYGEEVFQLKLRGHLTNEGRILSQGHATIENLEGSSTASFKNTGAVTGTRGLSLLDLDSVRQIGTLSVDESGLLKIHTKELIQDQPYSKKTGRGLIHSRGELDIVSDHIRNVGRIAVHKDALLQFGELYNQDGGFIECFKSAIFEGETFENHSILKGHETLQLSVKDINNTASLLGETVRVEENEHFINTKKIKSQRSMTIESSHGENVGLIHAGETLFWKGDLFQNTGQMDVGAGDIKGRRLENRGSIHIKDQFTMRLESLENETQGTFSNDGIYAGQILFDHVEMLKNKGDLVSAGLLKGFVRTFENSGKVESEGFTDLNGENLTNRGEMHLGDILSLNLSRVLKNQGEITGSGEMAIEAAFLEQDKITSKISTQSNLTLSTQYIENLGTLGANGAINLKIRKGEQEESSSNKGIMMAGNRLTLDIDQTLKHENEGNLTGSSIFITGLGRMVNEGGLLSQSDVVFEINTFENRTAMRVSDLLRVTGKTFENTARIDVLGDARFEATGCFLNAKSGQLCSQKTFSFVGGDSFKNTGDIQSQCGLAIETERLHNEGKLTSQGKTKLLVRHTLQNEGEVVSHDEMAASARDVVNTRKISTNNILSIAGETFHNRGNEASIDSSTSFVLQFTNWIRNEGSITGQQSGRLKSLRFENSKALSALERLEVEVDEFENRGLLASAGDDVSLKMKTGTQEGTLFSRKSMDIEVEKQLKVIAANGDQKSDIESQGNLNIFGAGCLENSGNILGRSHVSLRLNTENEKTLQGSKILLEGSPESPITFHNKGTGRLWSEHNITTRYLLSLTNEGQFQGKEKVKIHAEKTKNTGQLVGRTAIDIASKTLENLEKAAVLVTDGDLNIKSDALILNEGLIQAAGKGTLTTKELNNHQEIEAGKRLILNGETIKNAGHLIGKTGVDVDGETFENSGKTSILATAEDLNIKSDALILNEGFIQAAGKGTLTTKELNNRQEIATGKKFILNAKTIKNAGHLIGKTGVDVDGERLENSGKTAALATDGDLNFKISTLVFNEGFIQSAGNGTFTTSELNNRQEIATGKKFILNARTIKNSGQIIGGTGVDIEGETLHNQSEDAAIDSSTSFVLQFTNWIKNEGAITGQQSGRLKAERFENSKALSALGRLEVEVDEFENRGLLASTGDDVSLRLKAGTQEGTLFSKKSMDIGVEKQLKVIAANGDQKADIESHEDLNVFGAGCLENSGNILGRSHVSLRLNTENEKTLQGSKILLEGSPDRPITFHNKGTGRIWSEGNLTTRNLLSLTNEGQFRGKGTVNIQAEKIKNTGKLIGTTAVDIVGERLENSGKTSILATDGDLNFKISTLVFNEGFIQSAGNGTFTTRELNNHQEIVAEKSLMLNAVAVKNSGQISGETGLDIVGETLKNLQQSLVVTTGGDLNIKSSTLLSNEGKIQSSKRSHFETKDFKNNGKIRSQSLLELVTKEFKNEGEMRSHEDSLLLRLEKGEHRGWMSAAKETVLNLGGLLTIYKPLNEKHPPLMAKEGIVVQGKGTLKNEGVLITEGNVDLRASLANSGQIQGNKLDIATSEGAIHLTNEASGLLVGSEGVFLKRIERLSNKGLIQTDLVFEITSDVFENHGTISSSGKGINQVTPSWVKSGTGRNAGLLESQKDLAIEVGKQFENSGQIQSRGVLRVSGTQSGSVFSNAGEKATLWGSQGLSFLAAKLGSHLKVQNSHKQGKIESPGEITFAAGVDLENQGKINAGNTLSLSQEIFIHSGEMEGQKILLTSLKKLVNTVSGKIKSGSEIVFEKLESLTNEGLIQQVKSIVLKGLKVFTSKGELISVEGIVSLALSQDLVHAGKLLGTKGVLLQGQSISNSGVIQAREGTVGIKGTSLRNSGKIDGMRVTLQSASGLENSGSIKGSQEVSLEGQRFALKDAQEKEGIESKQIRVISHESELSVPIVGLNPLEKLSLKSPLVRFINLPQIDYLLEIEGKIKLKGSLVFSKGITFKVPDHFTNLYGLWGSGSLRLEIGGDFINEADCYSSKEDLTVKAKSLTNKGLLYGHKDSTIELTESLMNTKTIGSGGSLLISSKHIENKKGAHIEAQGDLFGKCMGCVSNTVGVLSAGKRMFLTGSSLINQRDGYYLQKTRWDDSVQLEEEMPNSQTGGIIQSKEALKLDFKNLTNAASTISSTQGNIEVSFQGSFDNQSKVLKRTQSSNKYVIVDYWKKKHKFKKSSWYPIYGYRWSGDTVPQGLLPAVISGAGDVIFENGRRREKYTETVSSSLKGLSNTGTISGKTVQATVSKLIHGLKDVGLVDLKSRVMIPVIEIVKYISGVGEGHYWREDQSRQKPFAINAIIESDTVVLAERSNRNHSSFMRGEYILSGMKELGLPLPSSKRLGQNTLVLSSPFWGGQVGNLLYDGDLPRIEPRDFNMIPQRVTVIEDSRMTSETRLFMPPQLEATLLQRALLQELKMPSLYANVTDEMQQHKILRENGVRQARELKRLPALEDERDVLEEGKVLPHREVISSDLLPQFQEPALVYRLMEYANEWVLGASLQLGAEIAKAVFQENQGQILGNYIGLNSHHFEVRQNMTGGDIDLKAETSGLIEGARIEATMGNLNIKAKTLDLPTRKSMIHKQSGANYHHIEQHARTELLAHGTVQLEIGETLKMASTHVKGGEGIIIDAGSITQQDESNIAIDHTQVHTKKKKTFGSKKTSTITHDEVHEVVRTLLEGGEGGVEIHVEKGGVLQAPIINGPKGLTLIRKNPHARFVILTSQDRHQKSLNQSKKGTFMQSMKHEGHVHTHVFMLESEGGLKGDLSHLSIQIPHKDKSLETTLAILESDPKTAWIRDLRKEKTVNWEMVDEIHQSWKQKKSTLTPAASVLCALVVGALIATSGLSAAILESIKSATLGAMTLGAVETMSTQITTAAINNKGRPDKILKAVGEKDSLKALGIAVATAGTLSSVKDTIGVNVHPSSLNKMNPGEQLTYYFKKSALYTGVSSAVAVIFNEASVKEALRSAAWRIPVDTLGGFGAKTIGGYRETLGYVMHKMAHAALGGALGFVLSKGDLSGAAVGAISGASSEIIGEALTPEITQGAFNEEWAAAEKDRRPFDAQRYFGLLEDKLNAIKDWTQVGVAFGTLLAQQDVKIASDVSDNALSNNLIPLAIGAAAASVAWEVYTLTHEEEIQATKEEIAALIARKLEMDPLYVEQAIDVMLLAGSIRGTIVKGGKTLLVKAGGPLLKESGLLKKLDIDGFKKPDSSLLPTQKSKDLRRYMIVLEEESKLKIPANQRKKIADYTRKNKLSELDDTAYKSHQETYNKPLSDKLKREWEQETGQKWPTYKAETKKGGHSKLLDYDSHHIIPQKNGGPHEWWNVHPVRPMVHEHTTHGPGSTLTKLQKKYVEIRRESSLIEKNILIKKGEQPWTIRPGQEWKEKIIGRAQKTGTDYHDTESYREAIKAAKRKDVEVITLNRGMNRLLPEDLKVKPNTRPDVAYRTKDGKIHQIEVKSKSDNVRVLDQRMEDTKKKLPLEMQGETDVIFIKGTDQ